MADRYNSSGYWSNQGSGHTPQYPTTIDEELEEDDQAYHETGEDYTYASEQDYQGQNVQRQYPQQQYQHQGYWTEEPQTYDAQDQTAYAQQYYQDQQYYQSHDDQGDVAYTPTTYGSMDVNYSEQGHTPPQDDQPSSSTAFPAGYTPAPDAVDYADDDDDRTEDFVAQRQDSYDRRDEFRTAPDTAAIRRVVDARRRMRESEAARARAAAATRERERERERAAAAAARADGGGSSSRSDGSSNRSGGSGRGSGSGSGGKGGSGKGSGGKGGGKSGGKS